MSARLCLDNLSQVPTESRPRVDPGAVGIGIVHIGVGAFHRAHQEPFTEDAVAAAGGDWGIYGVTPRSRTVVDQLGPQDGLYTVLSRTAGECTARVIGTLRALRFVGEHADEVIARIADPAVRAITLSVTEKGYRHDPATGRLRREDPGTRADAGGSQPRTVVGLLVRGLQARMRAAAGPVSVLCCDNLAHNGRTVHGLVTQFAELLPAAEADPLQQWLADQVGFPNSMVDRIVPATSPADLAEVQRRIGLADKGAVVTEPFRQWVIEDDFRAGRPAWERAGALLTGDVGPYEVMKLRLLNGAHSALAYLGALAGCATIAEAMGEPALAAVAARLMREDAQPTLDVPDGFDLAGYESGLLERFANPALRHRTTQVATDGSQKLPQRLLGTLRQRRAAGAQARWASFAVAAWMRWVTTERADDGSPHTLDDPLAPVLHRAVGAADTAAEVVARLLGVREVFGDDLPQDPVLRDSLADALEMISRDGALGAARRLVRDQTSPKEKS